MHVNRALMKHFLVHMIPGDWEVSAHGQKDLSRDKWSLNIQNFFLSLEFYLILKYKQP